VTNTNKGCIYTKDALHTVNNNLKKIKNKPVLTTIAKKAVIGVQTPSYTSAIHQ